MSRYLGPRVKVMRGFMEQIPGLSRKSIELVCALVLGELACAPAPADDDAIIRRSAPIVSGESSDASQDAVVLLVRLVDGAAGQEVSQCTGTLVAANLVLTARHCVSRVVDGRFRCDELGRLAPGSVGGRVSAEAAPGKLYVFTGAVRPNFATGQTRPAAAAAAFFHDGADVLCGHDLAFVLLDTRVTGTPFAAMRLGGPPFAGERVTAVGWGVTAEATEPKLRQQRRGIAVRRVGPSPAIIVDGGEDGAPVPPNEFVTGEATCFGDSGGPVLSEATGAIVGLTSAGGNGRGASRNEPAAGCAGADTANYFTAIAPFASVVTRAFRAAGAQSWAEGEAPPDTRENASSGGVGGCAVAPTQREGAAPFFLALLAVPLAWRRGWDRAGRRDGPRAHALPRVS